MAERNAVTERRQNSKSEARNPKQIPNSNFQMFETSQTQFALAVQGILAILVWVIRI
jgi:hypothetical protein